MRDDADIHEEIHALRKSSKKEGGSKYQHIKLGYVMAVICSVSIGTI